MNSCEMTIGDIFEEIAEGLAAARTQALMGEREAARGLFRRASLEFQRFREVLRDYPGGLALEYALNQTLSQMNSEEEAEEVRAETAVSASDRSGKPRRSRRKAA